MSDSLMENIESKSQFDRKSAQCTKICEFFSCVQDSYVTVFNVKIVQLKWLAYHIKNVAGQFIYTFFAKYTCSYTCIRINKSKLLYLTLNLSARLRDFKPQ